ARTSPATCGPGRRGRCARRARASGSSTSPAAATGSSTCPPRTRWWSSARSTRWRGAAARACSHGSTGRPAPTRWRSAGAELLLAGEVERLARRRFPGRRCGLVAVGLPALGLTGGLGVGERADLLQEALTPDLPRVGVQEVRGQRTGTEEHERVACTA